jgi:hypothetical protein
MIKLSRHPKPAFLSDEKVAELIARHKAGIKSVWNVDQIKQPLLLSSHNKCAYCECNINEESKYMEVEHFECKSIYPDKVVDWDNLLPSCKRCNGIKSMHDVLREALVNPYIDDPVTNFSIHRYRLKGLTPAGENAIKVIDLNDIRILEPRIAIGMRIAESVATVSDRYHLFQLTNDVKVKNRLIGTLEAVLELCQPKADYAATSATSLLKNKQFIALAQKLKVAQLWSDEMESLYQIACRLVL